MFSIEKNIMYQSRSNDEKFRDTNSLSNITGMATLKALSIFSFPFLYTQIWSEKLSNTKQQTQEIEENITELKEYVNATMELNADNLQETTPILSKAQGMVQHLKHTKNN